MRTWKARYNELMAAANLRWLRIEERDHHIAELLNGTQRHLLTVRGEYASIEHKVYRFEDGTILITSEDWTYGPKRRVSSDLRWYDSLDDAASCYGKMECPHNVEMFHALLSLSTVSQWHEPTNKVRARKLMAEFNSYRAT